MSRFSAASSVVGSFTDPDGGCTLRLRINRCQPYVLSRREVTMQKIVVLWALKPALVVLPPRSLLGTAAT